MRTRPGLIEKGRQEHDHLLSWETMDTRTWTCSIIADLEHHNCICSESLGFACKMSVDP